MLKNRSSRSIWRVVLLTAIVTCFGPLAQGKRNDDVVFLKNGDRMTGEIKGLLHGELRFKASYMAEAVRIDWAKVERLESKDQYLIFLTSGKLFSESLRLASANADEAENFQIGLDDNGLRVKQMEVLRISPIEARFWRQLEGSIDFGFNFTSGNDQYQTQLAASATYRKRDHSFTASGESVFSGQSEGSSSARNQFTFDYRKQVSPKWFVGGLFDLLRSDQQSLALRTSAAGIVGRNIRQTERTRLSIFAGLAGTRENYSATIGKPKQTNADAVAGVDFLTFRFKTTDIRGRLIAYPSLTIPGRVRVQATSDLRIELIKDLYLGFHLYESLDSKPPVSANKNELGISTSLGWKF